MPSINVPGGISFWPFHPASAIGTPNLNTTSAIQINAIDEAVAFICRVPKTGNMTGFTWITGSTVATGATMTGKMETVNTGGSPQSPSGTLYHANATGTVSVTTGETNTLKTVNFGAAVAVTRGDLVAIVIKQPSSSAGDMRIGTFGDGGGGNCYAFPYMLQNQATSPTVTWTTAESAGSPVCSFNYDDSSAIVPLGFSPVAAIDTGTYSTSSTPDVKGARFTTYCEMVIEGFWVWPSPAGSHDIKLVTEAYHQGNQTGILASIPTVDSTLRAHTSQDGIFLHRLATPLTLPAGTYRLIVEPTTTTAIKFYSFTPLNAGVFAQYNGANWHTTEAKDPTQNSDWTNYNNGTDGYKIPYAGLLVSSINTGTAEHSAVVVG